MEKEDSPTRLLVVGTYTALYCRHPPPAAVAEAKLADEATGGGHCSLSTPLVCAWVSIFVIELS